MIKIEKIYPRDIIAFFVLMFSLTLIALGINAIVSGIVIMIVTYYFTNRANGIERKRFPRSIQNPSEPKDYGKYHYHLKPDKP